MARIPLESSATMRVVPLGSGSAGNATLVESGRSRTLIDCGLLCDDLEERLAAIGVAPRSIGALLLTHRHRDHIRGATEFAARHRIKIRGTKRTVRSIGNDARRRVHLVPVGGTIEIGTLRARNFPLSHDIAETVGWRLWDATTVYGHATDLGSWDDTARDGLTRCHVLSLEFNHDLAMLAAGPYSPALQQRVGADTGHLNNEQANALLRAVAWPGLRHVYVAHVSSRNNTPELALTAARAAVGPRVVLAVAQQEVPTTAFERGVAARRSVFAAFPEDCVADVAEIGRQA